MFSKKMLSLVGLLIIVCIALVIFGYLDIYFSRETIEDDQDNEINQISTIDKVNSFIASSEQEKDKEDNLLLEKQRENSLKAFYEINESEINNEGLNDVETLKNIEKEIVEVNNKKTNNYNCLAIGTDGKEIEMISLYTINNANGKSGSIFIPTDTIIRENKQHIQLKDIYKTQGIKVLKKTLEEHFEVKIANYIVIEKKGMSEFEKIIGPIFVNGKEIDLENLFTMNISDEDEEIIRKLTSELVKPSRVIQIPQLIKIMWQYVSTDLTLGQIWEDYKMMQKVDLSSITKKVLWGKQLKFMGNIYTIIPEKDWKNIVWEITY